MKILQGVWPDAVVEEANLTQSISVLRRSLGEKAGENKYIITVAGRGYQFAGITAEAPAGTEQPPARRWPRRSAAVMTGAIAVSAALVLVSNFRTPGQSVPAHGPVDLPTRRGDAAGILSRWETDRVRMGRETGDNEDIYVSLVGTGSVLRLTTKLLASDSSPSWSPDGQYIAFYRNAPRPAYFIVPAIGAGASNCGCRARRKVGRPEGGVV